MVGRNLRAHPAAKNYDCVSPDRSELNLLDREVCASFIEMVSPDIVIHAAGKVGGIQANMSDPVGFLVENINIGCNVVTAARKAGVPAILNLGSSCMYPRNAPNPLDEASLFSGPLEPTNEGYALAKLTVARLCEYISRTDGLKYRTVIPCNVYGPFDKFDPAVSHLVPGIISKFHQALINGQEKIEIWGDGTARREFMYAADLADGIWHMVDRLDELPAMVNLGMGHDRSILEYYQTAAEVVGWQGRYVFNHGRPEGMRQKKVSTTRQTSLGWLPTTSLRDGLAKTYQYYLTFSQSNSGQW